MPKTWRWMGPKGTVLGVARLDLHLGGIFLYSMTMPNGLVMWGRWIYRELVPGQRIVVEQSFSDAQGGITGHPMSATWPRETLSTTSFESSDDGAMLPLNWLPLNANDEQIATFDACHGDMLMGWAGSMNQLEQSLDDSGAKA